MHTETLLPFWGAKAYLHIYILEIPAHIYIYIYIYICMQVGIKWFAHTNLITIYIFYISIFYLYMYTHSTHEIFYMNKINDETFPLGVGVASGPSAPYGTRLGTDGSGL